MKSDMHTERMIRAAVVHPRLEARVAIKKLLYRNPRVEVAVESGSMADLEAEATARSVEVLVAGDPLEDAALLAGVAGMTRSAPGLAAILVTGAEVTPALLRQAMSGGVRDVLCGEAEWEQLPEAVDRWVLATRSLQAAPAPAPRAGAPAHPCRVITVFSAKGGCGKTVVAVNAACLLARRARTLLVDLDLQFGDVDVMLDLKSRRDIAQLSQDTAHAGITAQALADHVETHRSGLHVLPAPPRPERAEMVTADQVARLIEAARSCYEYVVVDTTPSLDDVTLRALDISDIVVLVTSSELPSVKNTRLTLDLFESLKYPREKVVLVVNRESPGLGLSSSAIAEALQRTPAVCIPSDGRTVVTSVNTGAPFVLDHAGMPVARAIQSLVDALAVRQEVQARKPTFFGRLFARRRMEVTDHVASHAA